MSNGSDGRQTTEGPRADPSARTFVYTWLLPLLYAAITWTGFQRPGEGHGLWLAGSFAGTWPLLAQVEVGRVDDPSQLLPRALLFGCALYLVLGFVLDRLRARPLWLLLPWIVTAAVLAAVLVAFPPRAARGDPLAYGAFAVNLGLLVATLVAVLATAVTKDLARLDRTP